MRLQKQHGSEAEDFPWWLVATLAIGGWLAYQIVNNDLYSEIFKILLKGLGVTAFVTLTAFSLASLLGLLLAAAVLSPYLLLRQLARFYIEILRGIPILVLLFYIAFVGVPSFIMLLNHWFEAWLSEPIKTRDFPLIWRAIFALMLAYSAFIAEVFRAGLQSVDQGQREAALSLGLTPFQRFKDIVFPQAFKTILPPLGNDFIAMIKDSSLVSVLGVADITQLGKVYAAGSFRFMETYNIVAYLYLIVTVLLSLLLRKLELRLRSKRYDLD